MKALILTEGGRVGGLGHIIRCSSLVQAFSEKGISSEFFINGDESVKKADFEGKYRLFNWLQEKDKIFDLVDNFDIVVVDSYQANKDFYNRLSKGVKIPVYIDDNKRIEYPRGVVINSAIGAGNLNYSNRDDGRCLLGCQYAFLRSVFWNTYERITKDKIKNIMITTGGHDPKNVVPKIIDYLKIHYPLFEKNVIVGNSFQNINEINIQADNNTNLVMYPNAEKMKDIMLQSDIAISSGGQTLFELARMGVPTIAFCQAENQRSNLESWEKEGFIGNMGDYANLDLKLSQDLEKLALKEERVRRSGIGMRLVDGQGPRKIIDILINIYGASQSKGVQYRFNVLV